jgi:hypothetical protein
MDRSGGLEVDRELDGACGFDLGGSQRQISRPLARRVCNGIGNSCRGRSLTRLFCAKKRQTGPVDEVYFDAARHVVEAHRGGGRLIHGSDTHLIEGDVS